jgi:arabinose-5-phosphate isomerase
MQMSIIKEHAIKCFHDEAKALLDLIPLLTDDFDKAVELIYQCRGKIIVTGIGKSGHIAAKIAATFASTGTPAFFVNPVDALHGDLGMITADDVVLAISNSGQTDELLRFIPFLLERKIPLIGMSGNPSSLLVRYASYHLNISVEKEACPLNLAPTSSTTAALAMGDAIACALINLRDFRSEDYAQFHPSGTLGKRLLMKVKDVMRTEDLPVVKKDECVVDILVKMNEGRLGLVIVIENSKILGLVTNGDLRRIIQHNKNNFLNKKMMEIMNTNPITIKEDKSLFNAEEVFKEKKANIIIVLNNKNDFIGVLDIHDMEF